MTPNEWRFIEILFSFIIIGSLLILSDNVIYIGILLIPWLILMIIYGSKIEHEVNEND